MSGWVESERHLPHALWLCDCGTHVFKVSFEEELAYVEIIGEYRDLGWWQRLKDALRLLFRGEQCPCSFVCDVPAARDLSVSLADAADKIEKWEAKSTSSE